ncbi:CocE/NonD family hydrolase [Roseomonas sp. BN140053]|uniref:CocE/NonD family hydrolase n=1 Tax=Roseomonas sp. BN140053 TaxID=3391898 RepID=UPI0039E8439A
MPDTQPAAMIVEKDAGIPVNDGHVLRANIYRPPGPGRFPVIMTQGVYGKDVHFADGYAAQWEKLHKLHPDVFAGSSGRYLRWELVDPERWVPDGFVVIAVDSRGSGKSPGFLDPMSPREIQDYHDAVEWAGTQPWSNGRVGLLGISYLAHTQWRVAALRPRHLAAIIPWEGFVDPYRDRTHHGGIFSNSFTSNWLERQVLVNQNGNGATRHRDRDTGLPTTGEPLSEEMLAANRVDYGGTILRHTMDDAFYRERRPDLSRIEVPVLSCGNWGGPGVHLRGNIEGFTGAGSAQKWLTMHLGTHFESFYLPEGIALQRRFFERYLKGIENGWEEEPRVQVAVRRVDGAGFRTDTSWPLSGTRWTRQHLDAGSVTLRPDTPATAGCAEYDALGEGLHFSTAPFAADTEFTGSLMARLWIASSTEDADIFATLRLIDPAGEEVVFAGAHEPTPVARGWLRASHRRTDPERSLPWRPWHGHDRREPLVPGEPTAVEVEIWPTSIVCPAGYRLVLTLAGRDFQLPGTPGRILHDHPADRGHPRFAGRSTVLTGPEHDSFLLLPLIPD